MTVAGTGPGVRLPMVSTPLGVLDPAAGTRPSRETGPFASPPPQPCADCVKHVFHGPPHRRGGQPARACDARGPGLSPGDPFPMPDGCPVPGRARSGACGCALWHRAHRQGPLGVLERAVGACLGELEVRDGSKSVRLRKERPASSRAERMVLRGRGRPTPGRDPGGRCT